MSLGLTKLAQEVFSPVDAGNNPRSPILAEEQTWGVEIEGLVLGGATQATFETLADAQASRASALSETVLVKNFSTTGKSRRGGIYRRLPSAPTVFKPWHWTDAAGVNFEFSDREIWHDQLGAADPSGLTSSTLAFQRAIDCGMEVGRPVMVGSGEFSVAGLDYGHLSEINGMGRLQTKIKLANGSNRSLFRSPYMPISTLGGNTYLLPTIRNMTLDGNAPGQNVKASIVTITIASPGVVTWNAHGFVAGHPIIFSTTGTLPTGITAGVTYFVRSPTANNFQISSVVGGAAINTTATQSGTHTATEAADALAMIYFPSDNAANINSATLYGFAGRIEQVDTINAYADTFFFGDNRNTARLRDVGARLAGRDHIRFLSGGDHNLNWVNLGSASGHGILNAGGFQIDIIDSSSYANALSGLTQLNTAQDLRWVGGSIDRNRGRQVDIVGFSGATPAGIWNIDIDTQIITVDDLGAQNPIRITGNRPIKIDCGTLESTPTTPFLVEIDGTRTEPVEFKFTSSGNPLPYSTAPSNRIELICSLMAPGAAISSRQGVNTMSLEVAISGALQEILRLTGTEARFLQKLTVDATDSQIMIRNPSANSGSRNYRLRIQGDHLRLENMADDGVTVRMLIASFYSNGVNSLIQLNGIPTTAAGAGGAGSQYLYSNAGVVTIR